MSIIGRRPAAAAWGLLVLVGGCSVGSGSVPTSATATTVIASPARTSTPPASATTRTVQARIGDATFLLRDTPTAADQARGLSVLDRLDDDEGMLFRLGSPRIQGMWMKDMRFSIDILWIGADNTVVHLEHEVAPSTYPTVFRNPPDRPAVAVVELAAGAARRNRIGVGTTADLGGR